MPEIDLGEFWSGYHGTLARIRAERPATVDAVAGILNDFEDPSAGIAFFGHNADDQLSHALSDTGWTVTYLEHDYLWDAQSPSGGEWLHCVEGDIYRGRYRH